MPLGPHTGTRTRPRRHATCHRHPNQLITGLCALCLRDRLTVLDSSSSDNIISFRMSRRNRLSGASPELRRSKSVAVEKHDDLNLDLRRKSCDVRVSNRLTDLFDVDDDSGLGGGHMESKNVAFSRYVEPVLEIIEDNGDNDNDLNEIRVLNDIRNNKVVVVDNDIEFDEGNDLMTMKEHIEIELMNKRRNFWEKLRKWSRKGKEKKRSEGCVDHGLGRRSCDTAPRFSIDVNSLSMEDTRFMYDEHSASWDGYMVARTIPRLTPMLPIVDDVMLPPVGVDNRQVMWIKEESSSSAGSGKDSSESCSLNTGSSSSSIKSSSSKTVGLEQGNHEKLVITEKELKDWHLKSINNNNVKSASNALVSAHRMDKSSNGSKKEMNGKWRKMSNLWSYKHKLGDKTNGHYIHENVPAMSRNNETNGVERGNSSTQLVRNGSLVGSRTRNESHRNGVEGGRYSMSDIDSGLLKLYLSPFRKSRTKLHQSVAADG